jgi:hypothetical protein
MQQLTKSLGSFTWAMSLFGVQQSLNIFRPPPSSARGPHPATEAFRALTDATVQQLGPTAQQTFQTVDNLQRQMLDLGLSLATLGLLSRNGSLGSLAQRTAGQLQQLGNCACAQSGSSAPTGWGPVPIDGNGAA